ncbi:MAG TPA: class I SAM-dependent RNA methyltransferase [Thermoanaerobaculia bacterium]|nr:class I SAM-dependent RNA methyltransferase [Thermoanaerobaculia bacterium]
MPVESRTPASVARTLARLDVVEVVVEKLVAGGEGLARVDGAPLFIPLAAPGDRLRARVVERHPDFGRARILEVLSPGPGRREPPCPHFASCGGCDLQHLDDELQTVWKARAALETLRRLGRLERLPEPRLVRARAWGYRMRAQVRTEPAGDGVLVGYFARGSHALVPIRVCPILEPELEAAVIGLRERLGAESAPRRIDLASGDDGRITVAPPIEDPLESDRHGPGVPRGPVTRRVGPWTYELDARVFFQAHAGLAGDLQREVCGRYDGSLAVDLYAGVGLFTLPLGRRYRRVIAVESDRLAARYAVRNARANGLANVEVLTRSAESFFGSAPPDIDRVVVDPPRTGLPQSLRRALLDARVPRLTYASCHPATLARDLRDLTAGYAVTSLALLDLFPQTGHLEMVAQLERTGASGEGS